MHTLKTYPEAHDAWLNAMGIDVRWRYKESGQVETNTEVEVKTDLPIQTQTLADNQIAVQSSSLEMPAALLRVRYWLVGEGALSDNDAFLLAGMLWSLNLNSEEVAFVTLSHQNQDVLSSPQRLATALPAWAELMHIEIALSLLAPLAQHSEYIWMALGDVSVPATELAENVIRLPSIQAMHSDARQKRAAWQALKSLR